MPAKVVCKSRSSGLKVRDPRFLIMSWAWKPVPPTSKSWGNEIGAAFITDSWISEALPAPALGPFRPRVEFCLVLGTEVTPVACTDTGGAPTSALSLIRGDSSIWLTGQTSKGSFALYGTAMGTCLMGASWARSVCSASYSAPLSQAPANRGRVSLPTPR